SVLVVWTLGRVGSSLPPATLLLAGVTVAMGCAAASMLIQYLSDYREVSTMVRWMMGELDVVRWETIARSAVGIGVGLGVLLARARDLNALASGPEAAASVGVAVGRAGPIGFVGLMIPHAMRVLVGPDHRVLLPASILAGGAFLVVCDT